MHCRFDGFVAAVVLGSIFTGAAHAAIFNLDISGLNPSEGDTGPAFSGNGFLRQDGTVFSSPTDPAATATSGHWNQTQVFGAAPNTPTPATGFSDSSATPTNVSITLSNWAGADDCSGCAYGTTNALLEDYLVQADSAGPAVLRIQGLKANTSPNLILYTTNNGSTVGAVVTVNSSTAQTASGDTGGGFPGYIAGTNFLEFDGVNTGANGEIDVTVTGETASLGIINGFQLSAIPEPSSLALVGVGGAGVLARRRKAR